MTAVNWPVVLQVQGKPVDAQIIERQYRLLARKRHPDAGGSNEAMTELNLAKESALKWVAEQIQRQQQAEAAKVAASQAEAVYHQIYAQQMQAMANAYQQQWANMAQGLGGLGNMNAAQSTCQQAANPEPREEKRKTKWQRVKEIFRGAR
jgi:hypothetical protein